MQYKVYFINQAFKDVLNRDVLLNIINRECDEFQKKQVKLLLNDVKFSTILSDAKEYFKHWSDMVYMNNEIIIANRITNEVSRLFMLEQEVYVAVNREDDILITFLNAKYRPIILEPSLSTVGTTLL